MAGTTFVLAASSDWFQDLEFLVLILMGLGGTVASWLKKRRDAARAAEERAGQRTAPPRKAAADAGLPPFLEERGGVDEGWVLGRTSLPAPPPPPPLPPPAAVPVAAHSLPLSSTEKSRLGTTIEHTLGAAGSALGEVGAGFGDLGLVGGGEYGRLEGGEHGTSLQATGAAGVQPALFGRRGSLLAAGDRRSWRRAVILAEILAPPRALGGTLPAGLQSMDPWPVA